MDEFIISGKIKQIYYILNNPCPKCFGSGLFQINNYMVSRCDECKGYGINCKNNITYDNLIVFNRKIDWHVYSAEKWGIWVDEFDYSGELRNRSCGQAVIFMDDI